MSVISVSELRKYYGDVKAVDGVSFEVEAGEVFGILGPNGAGKTTTLEMMEGLRKPDSGSIVIDGVPVWPNPGLTKKFIGVQLQSTALFDYLSVAEMLRLFGSFYNVKLSDAQVDSFLEMVSLSEKITSRVKELSGGQQQRLSIALALVNEPKVIFLDEPTTGLDPQARRRLWEVIAGISSSGRTIVLTTHYMEEAETLCRRVAVMDEGRVVILDTPARLIQSLGAKAKITFTTNPEYAAADLAARMNLPELTQVEGSNVLYAKDAQTSVLAVLSAAGEQAITIENLTVSGANLEDVFLHHTGKGLRD